MRWLALPRSLLAGLLAATTSVLCASLSFVMPPPRAWSLCCRRCARGVIRLIGLEVRWSGADLPEQPAVYISNHRSFLDPFILMAVLPATTKWVVKAELRRVPFLGRAVEGGGFYVDRGDRKAALGALREGIDHLPGGWSVACFPEGTRSEDGELRPFHHGATLMASHRGLPIVPIAICAPLDVLPRDLQTAHAGRVEVVVGEAIDTTTWDKSQTPERSAQLEDAVGELLAASSFCRLEPDSHRHG